ncbi:NAD(P)H-hydrate dehydratase [Aquidulcibacter sp.]|uniref:NAD(P)H-hydrate dehydratase n=1 Tax=Aquidulcibacter sp. TaxID=2052990 RepID=UPI0025BD8FFE|nr:NAD(P)H-hydrate dehydratase [Aquidulcibacter sp.]MCA3697669.1 NAD(P)H-hydrate dehydratase [Aquidulcibacter sp.]
MSGAPPSQAVASATELAIGIDEARAIPWPNAHSHKHSRGRLAVICGGRLQTGAARLAAAAGHRMGAGWVCLISGPEATQILACHETERLIVEREPDQSLSSLCAGFDAAVLGPAFGLTDTQAEDVLDMVQGFPGPLVLDADALTLIAQGGRDGALWRAVQARTAPTVLTPHSGEFTRLAGAFESDKKGEATLKLAQALGAIVVHKGAETWVASPDGRLASSDLATPFCASAGTGDVLAGLIGGLLAQSMPAFEAACAAVWIHATAANRVGPGLIASDLITALPTVLNDLAPEGLRAR